MNTGISDLTVIYYTANFINEEFAEKTRDQLIDAMALASVDPFNAKAGIQIELISVSQKPMEFGENICVGDIGRSHINIYKQALRGAKAAETKYIALAEDDVLYSGEHFTYRPVKTPFAYNVHKWSIFTWSDPPVFSYKNRKVINSLIADREAFIEAIEERLEKYPDNEMVGKISWGEPGRHEAALKLKVWDSEIFHSKVPNIVFSHPDAVGYGHLGKKKARGFPRLEELPYWGKASRIVEMYKPR